MAVFPISPQTTQRFGYNFTHKMIKMINFAVVQIHHTCIYIKLELKCVLPIPVFNAWLVFKLYGTEYIQKYCQYSIVSEIVNIYPILQLQNAKTRKLIFA